MNISTKWDALLKAVKAEVVVVMRCCDYESRPKHIFLD